MYYLTITRRGRVSIPKDALRQLGTMPGGKIEIELLPGGKALLRPFQPSGNIDEFIGLLAGSTKKVATIDEINQAAAEGWAGEVKPRR